MNKNKKPLIMAHAAGRAHGPENSLEATLQSIKYGAQVIELDLRKSSDAVLYCYHGFGVFKYWAAYFLKFFKFSFIQKITKADTLKKIIDGTKPPVIFYLDLKNADINAADIKKSCKNKHEIWIASQSMEQLKLLRSKLGKTYTYVYNYGFWNFKQELKKAIKAKINITQVFPWHFNKEKISKLQKAGIRYTLCNAIMSQKQQKEAIKKFGSEFVCYDNVKTRSKFTNGFQNI